MIKFSPNDINTLKNFSEINDMMLFKPGKTFVVNTVEGPWIVANADSDVEIPTEFGIYGLSQLLSIFKIFSDPEVEIGERSLKIRQDDRMVEFFFCSKTLFKRPIVTGSDVTSKKIVSFDLDQKVLREISDAAAALRLDKVAFTGENGGVYIKVLDTTGGISHSYQKRMGDTDREFNSVVFLQNWKMPKNLDYSVTVAPHAVQFISKDGKYRYWAAIEAAHSSY